MKRILNYLTILIIGVLIFSCTKEVIPELFVSLGRVILLSDGSAQTVSVTTNQSVWSLFADKDWITLIQEGNTLTISAEPNNTITERTANITITVGEGKNSLVEMVSIVQQGALPSELAVSQKSISLTHLGTVVSVTVTTNQFSWNYTKSEAWININVEGDEISIGAMPNTKASNRSGNVVIIAGSGENQSSETIVITQEGTTPAPLLSVSANSYSLPNSSTSNMVTITTNQSLWDYAADKNWISLTREGDALIIVIEENDSRAIRTANVTITAGEGSNKLTEIIAITQQGSEQAEITLTKSNILLADTGEPVNIMVTTNLSSWNYSTSENWIKVVKDGSLLKISANPISAGTSRNGKVVISAGPIDNRAMATIVVTQGVIIQATLSLSESTILFTKSDTSSTVTMATNQPIINFTVDKDWITIVKEGTLLTISASENTSPYTRNAQITITAGEGENTATETISVSQEGFIPATLVFSPENPSINQMGSAVIVTVTSNQPYWSYSVIESWLIVSRVGDVLTISATENIFPESRSANITVVTGEGANIATSDIVVTQQGVIPATVSVSQSTVNLAQDGVSSTTVSVTTNQPTWSFNANQTWIQVALDNGLLVITATPNLSTEKRTGTIIIDVGSAVNRAYAIIRVVQDKKPTGAGAGAGNYEKLF